MPGEPDELDRLWTPHRLAYIAGESKPAAGNDGPSDCPFCLAPTRPDDERLIVARGRTVYAVLNLYPYNPGHLMVCPYRHIPDYTDLDGAETAEFAAFTQAAMRVIRRVSGAHGFNVGMNQGAVAGAGIAAHLHQHVVPRWGGDTNFMPVIARTKTLPQLLGDTRALLAAAWADAAAEGLAPRPKRFTRRAAPRKSPAMPVEKAVGAPAATRRTGNGRTAKATEPSARGANRRRGT